MTITLNIDIKNKIYIKNIDKKKLSFLVSKVFEEYIEELQDDKLSAEIKNSKELDKVLSNIKY
jgi:hypothetical protein